MYIVNNTFDTCVVQKYSGDVGYAPLSDVDNKISDSAYDVLMSIPRLHHFV